MALPRGGRRTATAWQGLKVEEAVPCDLLSTGHRGSLAYGKPGSRDSLAWTAGISLTGQGSPMPFYQPAHRPTFASVLRSFAQDPDQALRQALPEALIERFAADEGVHFGEQANAVYTPP